MRTGVAYVVVVGLPVVEPAELAEVVEGAEPDEVVETRLADVDTPLVELPGLLAVVLPPLKQAVLLPLMTVTGASESA